MKSGTSNPVIPSTWTVPSWFIDPANSIACASDQNSGTSATCSGGCAGSVCTSGIGPLLTYGALNVQRWGCLGNPPLCPRIRQNTLITFLSSQPDSSDPVAWLPQVENNAWVAITGSLGAAQTVCTGNLSAVTNVTRGTNTLTTATLPCTAAIDELVIDTTSPSAFWTYKGNTPPSYFMTTPLSSAFNYTIGTSAGLGSEVTIGNDAVTVYTPVTVNLVEWSPTNIGSISSSISSLSNLMIGGGTAYRDAFTIGGVGQGVVLMNVYTTKVITSKRLWNRSFQGWFNSVFAAGIVAPVPFNTNPGATANGSIGILGGQLGAGNSAVSTVQASNVMFDADAILGGATVKNFFLSSCQYGDVFVDSGNIVFADGRSLFQFNSLYGGAAVLWGTGTYDTVGKTIYPAGASAGHTAFGTGGITIQENGLTVGCVGNPAAATTTFTCNQNVTPTNLDTILGTTLPNSCLYNPGGGGAFCNGGNY
jgi:hypothetical protein